MLDPAILPGPGSSSLTDVHPGDRPGHDEALDLAGALEDRVNLGVAVPPLHRVLAQEAGTAEQLHRPLGHRDRDLAGLELAHRALAGLELPVVAPHPGRPPDE